MKIELQNVVFKKDTETLLKNLLQNKIDKINNFYIKYETKI
jgi:hypothetical protein